MNITTLDLWMQDIDPAIVRQFRACFGDAADLSDERMLSQPFDWSRIARFLLTWPAWRRFRRVWRAAQHAQQRVVMPALLAHDQAIVVANAIYQRVASGAMSRQLDETIVSWDHFSDVRSQAAHEHDAAKLAAHRAYFASIDGADERYLRATAVAFVEQALAGGLSKHWRTLARSVTVGSLAENDHPHQR